MLVKFEELGLLRIDRRYTEDGLAGEDLHIVCAKRITSREEKQEPLLWIGYPSERILIRWVLSYAVVQKPSRARG